MSNQILARRKPNTTRIFTKLRERKIGGSENQRPKYRPSTVHRAAGVSRILIAGAIMLCSRGDVILNPVNNNPGILLLKQGRIMKQIDIFNLACVYNMTYLQSTINELATLFASINNTELYTMHTDQVQNSFRAQIEHNLSLVNRKIDYIIPQNVRRKRGLINGLGSVIKSITGNLDQQDALKFEADILAIKNKVTSMQKVQKKTLVIAENTIKEFGLQLDKINENQRKLVLYLENTTKTNDVLANHVRNLDIYVQIDFSLQIISDKLMILEDAITFSQLGVMHPSIISPQNLVYELLQLGNIYNLEPITDLNIGNIRELERSITVKAYSTKHSLTFILQIPFIDKSIYDLIHLYSIPDTEYLTIIPKSKFLALGSDEYAYLDNSCKSITESVHLCESLQMKSFTKSEDCIVNLIKHKNANCSRVKMVLGDSKIQKTRDNTWLVILKREEIVRAQCGTNTSYHRASGIHLITVTEDCRAEVANMTLQSHVTKLDLDEIIPLPQKQDSPVDVVRYQVKLQDLELDNVQRFRRL
ncbi:uncharacterized protein LOC123720268 [Pieris brassicae]|uniref:uncharacterized protein LOC123720268 n=1 Tax=Pieris brassicae TaxID=7116 RepID=UPI001E660CB6|nr:uncharacterized protein LOC123720268 [Pieris brassicae]